MESGQFIPVVIVNPLKGIWALHSSVLPPSLSSRRFAVPDRFFSTDELGMPDPSGPGPRASQRLIGDSNSNADERHWTQTYSLSEPRSIVTGRELLPPPQVTGGTEGVLEDVVVMVVVTRMVGRERRGGRGGA